MSHERHVLFPWFLASVVVLNAVMTTLGGDREPVVDCYIVEELQPRTPVGCSIIGDYGLDRKYNASVLNQLRFSFLVQPEPDRQYFSVEEEGGTIRTTRVVDREALCPRQKECFVKFDVAVRPIQFLMIIKVRIEVLDINDNSPTFDQPGVSFEISESSETGTSFPLPAADDLDSVQNGIGHYDIVPATDAFELAERPPRPDGSRQVRLVLRQALDRETKDFYQFSVVALDRGDPVLTALLPIKVTVLDVNDNAPAFDNATYEVRVREDVAPGTAVLRVRALDPDLGPSGTVAYSFTPDTQRAYGGVFEIRADSGILYTRDSLDFETQSVFLIYVTVVDRGEGLVLSSQASVVVRLEDINDNAPTIRVNAIAQNALQPEVMEDSDPGSFVAHVTVEDRDAGANGRFHCRIPDSSTASFFDLRQMYPTEFKVVTLARFDREVRDDYVLAITCRDSGSPSLTSSLSIRVKVTDRNDHSPTFSRDAYDAFVDENNEVGLTLTRVTATDRDAGINGHVTYALDDEDNGAGTYVTVDALTGVIVARISFDYENASSYEFRVIASDSGRPPRSGTAVVYVTVRDVDDEVLVFAQTQYAFIVDENQPSGTEVGLVAALDRDSRSSTGKVLYHLDHVDDSPVAHFRVNSTSGLISLVESLDREQKAVHDLLLSAVTTSSGGADVKDAVTAGVKVYVGDVNDHAPVFEFPTPADSLVFTSAQAPVGTIFAKVRARDLDTGPNAKLHFRITGGNIDDRFRIDAASGDVAVNRDLSSLEVSDVILEVTASDCGERPLSERARLIVRIRQAALVFPRSEEEVYALLASEDLAVVLVITLAAILVAIVVIVAIMCVVRKGHFHKRNNCESGGQTANGVGKLSDVIAEKEAEKEEKALARKRFFLRATSVDLQKSVSAIVTTLMDEFQAKRPEFETPPSQSKPVIVFVKDPMIKKISPNSDTSNSDSGRGHSSEEGDTLHRVQSVGRDHDNAPTPSLAPGAALATVAKDVRSLSDDDTDACPLLQPPGTQDVGCSGRYHPGSALGTSPFRLVVAPSDGCLPEAADLHCSHLTLLHSETVAAAAATANGYGCSGTPWYHFARARSAAGVEGGRKVFPIRERSSSFDGEQLVSDRDRRTLRRDGRERGVDDKEGKAAVLAVADRVRWIEDDSSAANALQRRRPQATQRHRVQLLLQRQRRRSLTTVDADGHLANTSSTIASNLDCKNGNDPSRRRFYGDDDDNADGDVGRPPAPLATSNGDVCETKERLRRSQIPR